MSNKNWDRILQDQKKKNYALPFYVTNPVQIPTPVDSPFNGPINTNSIAHDRVSPLVAEEKIYNSKRKFRRNLN